MKPKSTLVLYWIVVGIFALMLSWWLVFFVRQGTVLVQRAERAGAGLSPAQAAAVREAAHANLRMFLFEGGFLLLAFSVGVWLVVRSLRREVLLARQQHDFLSAVTHELRTPLSSARLALQSLALGRVPEAKRERYLKNAAADLERLSELVERVLESARVSSAPPRLALERLDLAEFTARTVRHLSGALDPAFQLEIEAPRSVPVLADASALETILRNLLANALKYGGRPGRLRVRVTGEEREATLEVRDFGPGVSGPVTERLFDPFVRGESELVKSQPGVGLGLYLVSELVRALGGRVSARNASDEGTGFLVEVRLPLAVDGRGGAA